ncbi:hypothetical protein C6P46_001588 [Rhodotorula mucilaginosa]|uniref:Uncharacterized protein n=1 Tax=Rhodotorula mucilaginosa TaxID=5537 RepID=A0A9P7B1Q1_RHOMI|nr:hypothetical protein C6P46_001588 [Rhodotorula mucilaginosa]
MRWQCVLRPCSLDRAGVAQRWLGHWFRIGLVRSDILSEFLAQLNYISKLSTSAGNRFGTTFADVEWCSNPIPDFSPASPVTRRMLAACLVIRVEGSLDFGGGTVFGDSVLEPAHNLHHSELLDEPAPNKVALDSAELARRCLSFSAAHFRSLNRQLGRPPAPTTGSAAPFSPPSTTWALVLAFDRDVGDLEVGKPGDEGTVEFDLLG